MVTPADNFERFVAEFRQRSMERMEEFEAEIIRQREALRQHSAQRGGNKPEPPSPASEKKSTAAHQTAQSAARTGASAAQQPAVQERKRARVRSVLRPTR